MIGGGARLVAVVQSPSMTVTYDAFKPLQAEKKYPECFLSLRFVPTTAPAVLRQCLMDVSTVLRSRGFDTNKSRGGLLHGPASASRRAEYMEVMEAVEVRE